MYGCMFSRLNLLNNIRNLLPSKHLSEVSLCVIYNEIKKSYCTEQIYYTIENFA